MNRTVVSLWLLVCLSLLAASCSSSVDIGASPGDDGSDASDALTPTAESPTAESPTAESSVPEPSATDTPASPTPASATPEEEPSSVVLLDPELAVTADRYSWESAGCEATPPAGYTMDCGWLTAPEIWEDPANSNTVRMHTAVVTGPDTPADATPLVYLEGGPGGDSLSLLSTSFSVLWATLVQDQPIVFFTQRGSAGSEPHLDCPETVEADLAAAAVANPDAEALEGAIADCADRLKSSGANFAAFNSVQSAHDVEALRLSLYGDEPWNVFGLSYGTRLGQTLMRLHPQGVRSIVLDAVVPNDAAIYADIPAFADRAFTELFSACAASSICNDRWPNLEDRYWAAAEKLDEEPVRVTAVDSATGRAHEVLVNGDYLVSATFSALYSSAAFAAIPELIEQIENDDSSGLSVLAGAGITQSGFLAEGMLATVSCHEELPFHTQEDWEAGSAGDQRVIERFTGGDSDGGGLADELLGNCESFVGQTADPVENTMIESDIPTLLLSGQFDPITPEVNAQRVLAGLSNATSVLLPHTGHGAVTVECGQALVAEFLQTLEAPSPSCLTDVPEPPWVSDPTVDLTLETLDIETFLSPMTVAVPQSWTDAGSGVYYADTNQLHQTALVVQNAGGLGYELFISQFLGVLSGGAQSSTEEPVVDSEGREWEHFTAASDGFTFDAYGLAGDGNSLIVILQSARPDRDNLLAQLIPGVLAGAQG